MKPKQTSMWLGLETQAQVDTREQIAEQRRAAFDTVINDLRDEFNESSPEQQDDLIRDLVAVLFMDLGPDNDSAIDPRF